MKTLVNVGGTRLVWWSAIREGDPSFIHAEGTIPPAFTLTTPRGELFVRFGRSGWKPLTERYAGKHGFPAFWYGPGGLSVCWRPRNDSEMGSVPVTYSAGKHPAFHASIFGRKR